MFQFPFRIDVSDASSRMLDDSKKFKWGAKKLNYVVLMKVIYHE